MLQDVVCFKKQLVQLRRILQEVSRQCCVTRVVVDFMTLELWRNFFMASSVAASINMFLLFFSFWLLLWFHANYTEILFGSRICCVVCFVVFLIQDEDNLMRVRLWFCYHFFFFFFSIRLSIVSVEWLVVSFEFNDFFPSGAVIFFSRILSTHLIRMGKSSTTWMAICATVTKKFPVIKTRRMMRIMSCWRLSRWL